MIIDEYAPLIFINSKDSFNARLFSLVHELVHIWYGKPELFNFNFQNNPEYFDKVSEQEINSVTENILLPKREYLNYWNDSNLTEVDKIKKIAKIFDVSVVATAIRARNLKLVKQSIVDEVVVESERKYLEQQKKNKLSAGGPNFYTNLAFKNDSNFVKDVIRSTKLGDTSYTEAFSLLNVKGTTGLNKLFYELEKSEK